MVVDTTAITIKVHFSPYAQRSDPVSGSGRRTGFPFRAGLIDQDIDWEEVLIMSRKKRTHLRGKRGQAFADKIRGIPLDCILCVSIDIH